MNIAFADICFITEDVLRQNPAFYHEITGSADKGKEVQNV